jgi:hypothetical protein
MPYSKKFAKLVEQIREHPDHLVAVIVHLNDTYLLNERKAQGFPGFPRLIATVRELRKIVAEVVKQRTGGLPFDDYDRVIVVHSGDFLGPSRIGMTDKGRTMVELLNRAGLNYCVLGNHEMDFGQGELVGRLRELESKVLLGNIKAPWEIAQQRIALWPSGTAPAIAFTGVISEDVRKAFKGWEFQKPDVFLKHFEGVTRAVPFRVPLTHALREEDRELREPLYPADRCFILGGHDHDVDWAEADRTPVYKNRSNLQSIRVFVLKAGGHQAVNALAGSYRERTKSGPVFPRDTKEEIDAVLEPLPVVDAQAFRASLEARPAEGRQVGLAPFADDDWDVPADALARRLAGLPSVDDFVWHLLRRDDCMPADAADEAWVEARLRDVQKDDRPRVLCDFTRDTKDTKFLDARDIPLRSRPTDFGVFVAECVRRAANADVAILNSGCFRADMELPPALRESDLRDTFLFDDYDVTKKDKRAIVVLTLKADDVDALIEFARGKAESGAYPQVSDRRDASKKELVVAINGYVMLDDASPDRYTELLTARWKKTEEDVQAEVRKRLTHRLTIVESVMAHAAAVPYMLPDVPPPAKASDHYVLLARAASASFSKGAGATLEWPRPWNDAFSKAIGSDTSTGNADFDDDRDRLRAFLREFIAQAKPAEWMALDKLHAELEAHRAHFRDDLDYNVILRYAVKDLTMWGPPRI